MLEQQLLKLLDQNSALIGKVAELSQLPVQLDRIQKDVGEIKDSISDIKQVVAVHATKIERNEHESEKLHDLLAKTRAENDNEIRDIHKRFDSFEIDIRKDISDSSDEVGEKLDKFLEDAKAYHDKTNERVGRLEKWLWTIVGGGAIIAWVAEHYLMPIIMNAAGIK